MFTYGRYDTPIDPTSPTHHMVPRVATSATPRVQRRTRRVAGLTREKVAAAALDLLDREGLDGFTMRLLAADLGVQVGALYVHVRDKETLLADVTELILGEIELPADEDWLAWLRSLAHTYRSVLHQHARTAQLMSGQLVSNSAHDFPVVEGALAALARGGFTGQRLTDAYDAYVGWLIGFVGVELAPGPPPESDWARARKRELRAVDATLYPTIAANLALLRGSFGLRWRNGIDAPMDHAFEASLAILTDGLAQNARQSRAATRRASRG